MDKNGNAISHSQSFMALVSNPVKFRFFLLKKLPAAFFSGLSLVSADDKSCTISVPYKWFTKNPFRSTYFACLAMAAEMSTGLLTMSHIYKRKPALSMLVVGLEAKYYKKAIAETNFICRDGDAIRNAIEKAIEDREPQLIKAISSGYNKNEELIAEFCIVWSVKVKE